MMEDMLTAVARRGVRKLRFRVEKVDRVMTAGTRETTSASMTVLRGPMTIGMVLRPLSLSPVKSARSLTGEVTKRKMKKSEAARRTEGERHPADKLPKRLARTPPAPMHRVFARKRSLIETAGAEYRMPIMHPANETEKACNPIA